MERTFLFPELSHHVKARESRGIYEFPWAKSLQPTPHPLTLSVATTTLPVLWPFRNKLCLTVLYKEIKPRDC